MMRGPIVQGTLGEVLFGTVFGKVNAHVEFLHTGADGVPLEPLQNFGQHCGGFLAVIDNFPAADPRGGFFADPLDDLHRFGAEIDAKETRWKVVRRLTATSG